MLSFPGMKILVGSRNPVKIASVAEAFGRYFPDLKVEGREVSSGVSPQPVGDETSQGAFNRAQSLANLGVEAEYFVGLEGGIAKVGGRWFNYGVQCVLDRSGRVGFGLTPGYPIPDAILGELLAGRELGDVADEILGEQNLKQKGGIISHLTRGEIDRKGLYVPGIIMALTPFLNESLYFTAPPGR